MEFIKNGKEYIMLVNGKEVGKIYKDETRNYNFQIVAKFNFEIKGYRNEVAGKTYKQVKQEAEQMYYRLMDIKKRLGQPC
ncbi:Uncharacterised protein [[Flavobacterium] thermophilum]|nr:Uncharacterised protein [[Flavobacterium] thermophilum]